MTPIGLRTIRTVAKRQQEGKVTGVPERAELQPPAPQRPRPDALHRAVLAGDIDGLKTALKDGADVNARDGRGGTALMHAASKGYTLMVESLLEAKADPDVRAADGATALFMTAVQRHSEIIELLMKAGADISIKGPKGKTATDVAGARYGEAAAARKKNEGRAVVALLEDKTWAMVVEEERRQQEFERRCRRWPAGKVFRDCVGCPEMVVIPPGGFMMGSPVDEQERYGDEGPRHRVMIPRPIAVGKHEVTFAEWDAYRLLSESEWEYVARAGTCGLLWGTGGRECMDVRR